MSTNNSLQSLIIVADQSTSKLAKAIDTIKQVNDSLANNVTLQISLIDTIAQKQAELAELEVQYKEARRQHEVNLELDIRANELEKVKQILEKQAKLAINRQDYNELVEELRTLREEFDEQLKSKIEEVRSQEQSAAAIQIRTKELELAAKSAEDRARINSLIEKNELLAKQVAELQNQVTEDRNARVEEAKARGHAVVHVQSGK